MNHFLFTFSVYRFVAKACVNHGNHVAVRETVGRRVLGLEAPVWPSASVPAPFWDTQSYEVAGQFGARAAVVQWVLAGLLSVPETSEARAGSLLF